MLNYWNTIMNIAIGCLFVAGNIQGQGVKKNYAKNVRFDVNAVISRKNLIIFALNTVKEMKMKFSPLRKATLTFFLSEKLTQSMISFSCSKRVRSI